MGKPKIWILVIVIVLIIVILAGVFGVYYFGGSGGMENHIPVELNPDSLASYISQQKVMKDIPEDSKINIRFGEHLYEIRNNQMIKSEVLEESEISIILPEEYIDRVGEVGYCQALKEANSNGDLSYETSISNSELAWKYKSMLKYRECFGN